MENGQKNVVSLDAGLDIRSSDMLVPISEPKFQHNRQKFQGKYLPSSVRFEHDGWAVGNDVYQFDIAEAFVEAGSFTVSKQLVNSNPTYKLIVKDSNKKQVGSVYYIPRSSIKKFSTDTAELSTTSGPNPILTGRINNKPFQLNYDSVNGTFEDKTAAANKLIITTDLKANYTFTVTVKDAAATIELYFSGMQLPSEVLQNGELLLGKFNTYLEGSGAVWSSNNFTFTLSDDGTFSILSDKVDGAVIRHLNVDNNTGLVSGSFTAPLYFIDKPAVALKEFYPFFSGLAAAGMTNTVSFKAASGVLFNEWSVTLTDREHSSSSNYNNQDKLFRNITAGHSDYNKQTIEQIVPIWFGISVRKGLSIYTTGLSVVTDAGSVYNTFDTSYRDADDDAALHRIRITLSATSDIKRYSGSVVCPNDLHIWEGTEDKTSDYFNDSAELISNMYTISVTYSYRYKYNGGTGTMTKTIPNCFYLDSDWVGLEDGADVTSMVTATNATIVSATVRVNESISRFNIDISKSRFYNGHNFSINLATGVITPPASLKGLISDAPYNDDYYNGNLLDDEISFWGRCCKGKVSSSLFISSTSELTSDLDATVFSIEQVPISEPSRYIDLSDMYYHKIIQASCFDSLSVIVHLCSKSVPQYMFYSTASGNKCMPGHIMHSSLRYLNSSDSNLSYYKVNKTYSANVVDTEYGLRVTVSGTPAKSVDEALFNYVTSISSSTDLSTLLPGNDFTVNVVDELIDTITFTPDKWSGWVDISVNSPIDADFLKDAKQDISMYVGGNKVTLTYLLQGQLPTLNTASVTYKTYNLDMALFSDDTNDTSQSISPIQSLQIIYSTTALYSLSFYKPCIFDNTFVLKQLNLGIAKIQQTSTGNMLTVNFVSKQVTIQLYDEENKTFGPAQECDETWGDKNSFSLLSEYIRDIRLVLCGVYNSNRVTVDSLSSTQMEMAVGDEKASVDLSKLFDPEFQTKMSFLYTRVNEEELKSVQFTKVLTDNEFQFLKQQWDTTNETENFWWLSDKYILALTKSKLIIKLKTEELTDWDGDKFVDVASFDRASFIDSAVLKYFCSSAYAGQSSRFITIRSNGDLIDISIYSFFDDSGELLATPALTQVTVSLTRHAITTIGEILCPDNTSLHTYSDIIVDSFISQSVWSATCIDNNLIIGCHYDNNLNQWAIIYHLNNNTFNVMQGYGFVGVDGSLTGGELPTKYFDVSKGFIGAVKSLDALSDTGHDIASLSELFTVKDTIVGTECQQWYISKEITSIVSHLTYDTGRFTVHTLPLNNNYSVAYDSASYSSTILSDFDFKIKPLKDLLFEENALWTTFMVLLGFPLVYFFDPRISVANYLQQSLGQAAYVHYNSTSVRQAVDTSTENTARNNINYTENEASIDNLKQKMVIDSDEISFDRQSIKQTQSTSNPYSSLFTMFAAAHVSALDWGMEQLQVNKNQNQSAVSDTGRKYSNVFMQNLNSMAIAGMTLQSTNPAQTSEVTAIKTLDMFYSTSDEQKVQAGRGWVNHNFVAQCIAQSTTSVQSEFSQQKLLYVISSLTLLPMQQTNKILNNAIEACGANLTSVAGPTFMMAGVASGGTVTGPYALAQAILYGTLLVARNATDIGLALVPELLSALGADRLNSTIVARQSAHNYDIEAKHKYGSKSECFMWPCFGVDTPQSITNESVEAVTQDKSWNLDIPTSSPRSRIDYSRPDFVTTDVSDAIMERFSGKVPYFIAMTKGKQSKATLPDNMAYVIGVESFLATNDFKNENISESEPVFPTPPFQDYVVDAGWQVSQTASVGMTTWVSVGDTKVIDGEFSNMVISEDFCGIAAPYTAVEVKRGVQQQYLRPWAITSQALALNQTGLNCCFEEKAYHAFDGYGYRVINWTGSAGMNKEHLTWLYSFLVNDRFKRSNKLPHNTHLGNFSGEPITAIQGDYNDKVFTLVTQPGENKGLTAGTIGEDKDIRRYALPVFSEFVNTLPAAVKTVSAQVLSVIDGVTSLTTENRDLQTAYKAPLSVDFTIGKNKYRFTQEYICSLEQQSGITLVSELVPCLGLEFIGSTPYEAYLYSQATRQYYKFTGGSSLQCIGMIERFRNVVNGRYDFVNQEVLMPCLATFLRLDKTVADDSDETDNVIIPRLKDNDFVGEVWPPLDTIYNTRSWFKTISLPCGIVYQGPNRCIINRFTLQDFMVNQVKDNYGLWKRVPREVYHPFREYKAKYETVDEYIGDRVKIKGWTHNPFLLVTAPLGLNNEVDCKFEWEITFCWPVEMDKLYDIDNYAVVNVQAETMTPGGKVIAERPTHIYLTKELFTRTGNYGYYSFRYQSNCGAGNRERLHIWSDQFICISGLQVEVVQVTTKRTEQLTQQLDVQLLKEI